MHIEHLSKSQIVLLTLLVSFVTSIATGIVTVSLMEQAPPAVSQTVNRVIERTVEKVTPAGQSAATVITRETTVVVKESELISQAVTRVSPSIVRLYQGTTAESVFLGLGIVVDGSGRIVSDVSVLDERADATAMLTDGSSVRVFVSAREASSGVITLRSATTTLDGKAPVWKPATLAASSPVLGQSVITLSGRSVPRIANGIINAVIQASEGTPAIIETSLPADSIMQGGPLANADGQIVGISTQVARREGASSFIAAAALAE